MDYTNIFAIAEINEEMYTEPHCGFGRIDKLSKVLKLLKSLYRMKQAQNTFFDKLKAGFIEQNSVQSKVDRFLLSLVYVGNTIITGPNIENINKEKLALG